MVILSCFSTFLLRILETIVEFFKNSNLIPSELTCDIHLELKDLSHATKLVSKSLKLSSCFEKNSVVVSKILIKEGGRCTGGDSWLFFRILEMIVELFN